MANTCAIETEAVRSCKTPPAWSLPPDWLYAQHSLQFALLPGQSKGRGPCRHEQPCFMPSPKPAWFFIPAVTRADDSCVAAGFSCILIRSNPYPAKSPAFAYDRAMLLLVISNVHVQLLNTDSSSCHHPFKVKNLLLILLLIHCSLGPILIKIKMSWFFWGRELRYLPIHDYRRMHIKICWQRNEFHTTNISETVSSAKRFLIIWLPLNYTSLCIHSCS